MRSSGSFHSLLGSFSLALLAGATTASCAGDFDTTREPSTVKTTLGEEMFTALCDRVGASSFGEDLSGRSFHGVCHKGEKGWKISKVDTSVLPPVAKGSQAAEQQRLAIAKVEAMARHRADLIEAFDTIFPDKKIDDPFKTGQQVRLHDALDDLTKRFTPLYESSPYTTKGAVDPPLLPASTQAIARFFGAIADDAAAQQALARIGSRQGYRPLSVALGTLRPLLAYPRLRTLSKMLIDRVGPGGKLEPTFQQVMRVVEQEMRTLQPDDPSLPAITVDGAKVQPNRARLKLEILSSLLLSEDDAFARIPGSSRYIVSRDRRGYAIPAGVTLGSVPSPFVADKQGLPAVDALGRYVDKTGAPLLLVPPFQTPGVFTDPAFGFDDDHKRATRGGSLVYQYVDTQRTLAASVLFDLTPLTATRQDDLSTQSTLMKTLEGAYFLYGDRNEAAKRTYKAKASETGVDVTYSAFLAGDTSPLIDLTYAAGQFLGAPGSDDYLGSILDLHEKHPDKTAEGLSLAWRIWRESKDAKYANAVLDDASTFWDELAEWLAKVARVDKAHYIGGAVNANPRGLLTDVTLALADPATVEWIPKAYAPAMRNLDRISYNPNDINGPPLDLDTGQTIVPNGGPTKPVNRAMPDSGNNRSAFQRFIQVIAAASKVKSCNKQGTLVKSDLDLCGIKIPLTYPIKLNPFGDQPTIDECDLFQIDDLGVFYVDSTLSWNHPRRAKLQVKDATLTGLLGFLGGIVPKACGELNIDAVLEKSTGITGLTTTPTPSALTRLVFFGAESSFGKGVPDIDSQLGGKNAGLNTFISNSMEPVGTGKCPKDAKGVNACKDFKDTLRGLAPNTFFISETPWLPKHPASCQGPDCDKPSSGFLEGMRPMLTAFANYQYDPDAGETCLLDPKTNRCAGEQLFLDLVTILDKHWSTGSVAKLSRYEELLAWVFADSGLFPVAADIVPVLRDQAYVSPRVKPGQTRSGLEVTADLLSFLFDRKVAKSIGLTNRNGSATTTWNDGKPPPAPVLNQVTPYELFVKGLRAMDARFDGAGDTGAQKKAIWRSARSQLVDQFLLAEGQSWQNPAIARAIPILGRLVREQVNANCPDRETTKSCDWARETLAKKLTDVLEGPLFATINDLQEALRADEEMRLELEMLVSYLLQATQDPDVLTTTLSALADLLQVLHDDGDLAPIFNTVSVASKPGLAADGKKVAEPGVSHATIKLMKILLDDSPGPAKTFDRYHLLDHTLRNLVTPAAEGKRTPLEVVIDVVTEVQRLDSSSQSSLAPEDYAAFGGGIRTFLVDPYRGMEQFYTIVKKRNDAE